MSLPFEVNVSSKYGAPMGRPSDAPGNIEGRKLHLRRVPLFDGDYDKGGAYWGGGGMPLWCAWDDECTFYLRATSRNAAKANLEGARFYR